MRFSDLANEHEIRAALGIAPNMDGIDFQLAWDAEVFADTWCDIRPNRPAVVHVDYYRHAEDGDGGDMKEPSWSWEAAPAELAKVLADGLATGPIDVRVNAWYFVYRQQQVAA